METKKLKIAVITPGRSHLLDMAVQFLRHGADVKFYTAVPKSRCERFGLAKKNVVSFFPICAPLMFLFRNIKFPYDINRHIYYFVCRLVDALSAICLKECDILISISGCSLLASRKAKQKYNALFFCDRGAKHIIEQDQILKTLISARRVFKKDINIELRQYQLADRIILPSTHSAESFLNQGVPAYKLFVNPYGVSLEMFHPDKNIQPSYDIIFVGNLSQQKGGDLLIEACRQLKIKLLHVGNISDVSLPEGEFFTHIDPIDQAELNKYYCQAKILALPSRQDGFGLVLFQAMACGLPLVYSHNTGGPDLKKIITNKHYLYDTKSNSIEDIKSTIEEALNNTTKQDMTDREYLTEDDKYRISWNGYGDRYWKYIKNVIRNNHFD